MAKGNPFWAKQSGKLGETVLAVVKGEQVQRAYNPEPVNPRSKGQTGQRIIFSSAVKFYKSAIARQFKFAFEDKKQKESDYNAFMRHNTSKGMMITREQYLNKNFPSIGAYMLSFGSLPQVQTDDPTDNTTFVINWGQSYETMNTCADLAKAFKNKYGLVDGDIITFVYITSPAEDIKEVELNAPVWNASQILVGDSSDSRAIESLPALSEWNGDTEGLAIDMDTDSCQGFAIILSRPTPAGLLVSTSELFLNRGCRYILEQSQDYAYKKNALASWGMGSEAVLQGTLLPNV